MSLFSFPKAGHSNKEESKVKTSPTMDSTEQRRQAILDRLNDLDLQVKDISVDLDDDKVTVYGEAQTQFAKELLVLAAGNNPGISTVDDRVSVIEPQPQSVFYEVKSGDTLSKIAKAQYGDAMKYNSIFEANKPMLKDPDKIYPGQVLRIPKL